MVWWLSATPFLPSPGPGLPQIYTCLGPLQAPPIATDLQAHPPSSQICLLLDTPWASAPPQPQPDTCTPSNTGPPSPWSGIEGLAFGSFTPAMENAAEESGVKHHQGRKIQGCSALRGVGGSAVPYPAAEPWEDSGLGREGPFRNETGAAASSGVGLEGP